MVDRLRSGTISALSSEFDAFLFASVGEDRRGVLLSVISALARSDVDPWQEAARLARLPGSAAIERLGGLIAALPHGPAVPADPNAIATRLVSLLPHHATPALRLPELARGNAATINMRLALLVVLGVIILAVTVLPRLILAGQPQAARPAGDHGAPTSLPTDTASSGPVQEEHK